MFFHSESLQKNQRSQKNQHHQRFKNPMPPSPIKTEINPDFSNKIRYFLSKQEPRPKFRKIRKSPFNFLCRSLSAITA